MAEGPLGSERGAREPDRGAGYGGAGQGGYYGPPSVGPGTSWISVLIGWLAAVGASVIVISLFLPFLAGTIGESAGARTGPAARGEAISPWSSGSYRSSTSGSVRATSGAEVYPSESAFATASLRGSSYSRGPRITYMLY